MTNGYVIFQSLDGKAEYCLGNADHIARKRCPQCYTILADEEIGWQGGVNDGYRYTNPYHKECGTFLISQQINI